MDSILELSGRLPLHALVGGLQMPPTRARHQDRIIDFFDLLFVRQGTVPIQEEGRAYLLTEGQTLILWPHRHHWGTDDFALDTRLYWLHFTVDETSISSDQSDFVCEMTVPQHADIVRPEVMESLFHRFIDDQKTGRLLPRAANLLLLLMLEEIADNRPLKSTAYNSNGDSTPAERARAYIQAHFHAPQFTVARISENLGYNADYLNRVFRQTYDHTLIEEIHRVRLDYARYLLIYSSSDIKEIAVQCGFRKVAYFSQLFKRYEGVTPTTFRRLNQTTDTSR